MSRKRAADVQPGDAIRVNDWTLHVRAVDHERGTALGTVEFAFVLHLDNDAMVNVVDGEA